MLPRTSFLAVLAAAATVLHLSEASISCYECDSSNNFTCTEFWDPTLPVTAKYRTNCRHVFDANYCVKMTGIFEGKLGTKRFCSSKNWGNYCEYIKRPGDTQEYRSCVFSCSTNDCNGANPAAAAPSILSVAFFSFVAAAAVAVG